MSDTDLQLLARYARQHAEDAFAELVRRHLDFVFSAALRQVRSPQLAEEVAQSAFTDLARNANRLAPDTILTAWLYQVTRRTAIDVVRRESRRQLREQIATEMNAMNATNEDWTHVEPLLDEAMHALDETDRAAVLLRYFENKSLREVGETLGASEEAARKRISRAVERLREFFAKRGVAVGASGLVVVISANAVQAAPVGLALTISTAAALAGTTIASAATATATKAIAMTTLQKTIVTATVAVLAGAGIYQATQNSKLREQNQALQQQQAPLAEQLRQLSQALTEATNQVAALREGNERLNRAPLELLKLRGEVGVLRREAADASGAKARLAQPPLSTAREYCERGREHFKNGESEDALDDMNKAIELDPNFTEALYFRAALYNTGSRKKSPEHAKAVADYSRMLELKPNDAGARFDRAWSYQRLQQYDHAIADYTTLIEGDADFSKAHFVTSAESKNQKLATVHLHRGRVYQEVKKDYSKAIADYTAALQLDPQIEGARRLRGQCYELVGETEKARQDFAAEQPKSN